MELPGQLYEDFYQEQRSCSRWIVGCQDPTDLLLVA